MGTRINVLLDHGLTNPYDRDEVLTRLSSTAQGALAVKRYWESTDPVGPHDKLASWRADPPWSRRPHLHRYTGPGDLFLTLHDRAAWIRTGGRWRGFLSITPLREVHLCAFRSIAVALGSSRLAYYADNDPVDDLFWDGSGLEECINLLGENLGQPEPSIDAISPEIEAATDHGVPDVWYLEYLPRYGVAR